MIKNVSDCFSVREWSESFEHLANRGPYEGHSKLILKDGS